MVLSTEDSKESTIENKMVLSTEDSKESTVENNLVLSTKNSIIAQTFKMLWCYLLKIVRSRLL